MAHIETERKYLIKYPDPKNIPNAEITDIVQTYLTSDGDKIRRVRKRGEKYIYTEKTPLGFGSCEEYERELTRQEYDELLKQADPNAEPIIKKRVCFYYEGQLFELDVYDFSKEYATLEAELDSIDRQIKLPPFIEIIKDVTGDGRYSNAALSKSQKFPEAY